MEATPSELILGILRQEGVATRARALENKSLLPRPRVDQALRLLVRQGHVERIVEEDRHVYFRVRQCCPTPTPDCCDPKCTACDPSCVCARRRPRRR